LAALQTKKDELTALSTSLSKLDDQVSFDMLMAKIIIHRLTSVKYGQDIVTTDVIEANTNEAMDLLETCDEKKAGWPPVLALLGECRVRVGDRIRDESDNKFSYTDESLQEFAAGEMYFKQSLDAAKRRKQPLSGETVLHLAQCLARQGHAKNSEAAKEFRRAIDIADQYHGRKSFMYVAFAKFWFYAQPSSDETKDNCRRTLQDARASLVTSDLEHHKTLDEIVKLQEKLDRRASDGARGRGRGRSRGRGSR